MDFSRRFEDDAQALIDTVLRRLEAALQPFADALDSFLAVLFSGRLPVNWREQWHQFVTQQAAEGFLVEPKSVRELEDWIEAWARYCELLPLAEIAPAERIRHETPVPAGAASAHSAAPIDVRNAPSTHDALLQPDTAVVHPAEENIVRDPRKRRPTTNNRRELFFYGKLHEALNQLDELHRVLTKLGTKLDGAKLDETVDVEADADQIKELIWRYNNAVESALDSWLRDDLSREASTRLNEMPTPASLGLPRFTDAEQAARALKQASQVAQRSRERDAVMDRIVTGLEWTETATDVTAMAIGVGLVGMAAKQGGRWVFVKTVAAIAATALADKALEHGLRAAGASEQTIRGVKLAAMVVTLILLHRNNQSARANASPAAAPKPPSAPIAPRAKPAMPPPVAEVRAPIGKGKTQPYKPHVLASESEKALAESIHNLPNEVVIRWGKPVTANGTDIISYNLETKRITFWDDKFRSRAVRISPSKTFSNQKTMRGAVTEASEAIESSQLSAADKAAARESIDRGTFETKTHGSGSAKNSTFGDHR